MRKAAALADHQCGDKARDPGVDLHHRSACEVQHAPLREEAAAPHGMGHRRIDDERPCAEEPQQSRELHAIGEGAADDGRRDDGEGHLEGHEQGFGDGARQAVLAQPHEEQTVEAAGQRCRAVEGEAVADGDPQQRDEAAGGEALHHGREHVLLAHQPGIEQGEPRHRHHQHQASCGEQPGGVRRIEVSHCTNPPFAGFLCTLQQVEASKIIACLAG